MLLRFRADVVGFNPSTVVILAGINDIAGNTGPATVEEIANNIFSMADIARSNGINVMLCSVLPAFNIPWRDGKNSLRDVPLLNEMIKAYAEAYGLGFVDYYSMMVDERGGLLEALTYDGLHPNEAGYQLMEGVFLKAIK